MTVALAIGCADLGGRAGETVHVNEQGTVDAPNGSQEKPYKSIVDAYVARGSPSLNVLVYQQKDGEDASWQPATASALKKHKKLYDAQLKKEAKAAEAKRKEETEFAARREQEAKRLEESKKIVLTQPGEPATRIQIRKGIETRDTRVRVFGWVHRLRQQGGMTFVILRDGTGYLQCILTGPLVRPSAAAGLRSYANEHAAVSNV